MSTARDVTVIFDPNVRTETAVMASSTGIERDNIKDMKIGDRIRVYCVPVGEGGGGDYKTDPYITFDINDALDHLEKYYGITFATTIKVDCSLGNVFPSQASYSDGADNIALAMAYLAYKVDTGVLISDIYAGPTSMAQLNRQNLVTGDGWRLLGPKEISKYLVSDLNGTLDPTVNPWKVPTTYSDSFRRYTYFQMPHTNIHDFIFSTRNEYGTTVPPYIKFSSQNYGIGWSTPDSNYRAGGWGHYAFTSTFLYQYVDSKNAMNIYY